MIQVKNKSSTSTIKLHVCNFIGCHKEFTSFSTLSRHELIHTGDRPFACNYCDKRFNQKGNLSKHLASHENAHLRWNRSTTEKPFKCPFCPKSFTVKTSLQNHLTQHNSEGGCLAVIPMQAPNAMKSHCLHEGCQLTFDTREELLNHIREHAPGMAAESRAKASAIAKLINIIETWDKKDARERLTSLFFASNLKGTLLSCDDYFRECNKEYETKEIESTSYTSSFNADFKKYMNSDKSYISQSINPNDSLSFLGETNWNSNLSSFESHDITSKSSTDDDSLSLLGLSFPIEEIASNVNYDEFLNDDFGLLDSSPRPISPSDDIASTNTTSAYTSSSIELTEDEKKQVLAEIAKKREEIFLNWMKHFIPPKSFSTVKSFESLNSSTTSSNSSKLDSINNLNDKKRRVFI